ncbi:S-adenosyl-L-methionine-dependent methyltransferase [Parasponia andersonii]|uniref:ETFB lysine methyltransferase n=1 Tax=Parasponia andersonii TaxID=3476 RepID=A0A2P5AC79_PARAD|nr:S-adenosyl-L-methionine-dependent methyltransferase [Parasponia andersonii]
MLGCSSSNFVKHLSYTLTLSSRCFHFNKLAKTIQVPPPLFRIRNHVQPNAKFCSETSQTDTSTLFSPYLIVNVRCHKDAVDMLSEALLCFGASSTTIDEKDAGESSESDDDICVSSIFPEGHNVSSCISHAADSIGLKEIPKYEVRVGEQYDWIKKTQESFSPVKVTEGLWIVPEWRTPPDVKSTNIILNPGLAFGTGEHPTTKLCLLLLHGLLKGGELFLDYGTGSGILAIAALKFGASSVGIDIDPQAIASARQNAALNDIGPEKLQLHLVPSKTCSPVTDSCEIAEEQISNEVEVISEKEKYDVVIANILLTPLLDLAENIMSYAKPGAVIGLSGILSEQVPYIMERYSPFLEGISVTEMDDWACVYGTKKTKTNHVAN